jgi:hypothetical protein
MRIASKMKYKIIQEKSIGVDARNVSYGKYHAVNLSEDKIIYSGSFEDCVRAIDRQKAVDKSRK